MSQPAQTPPKIADLVARFSEHRDTYRRGDYNETQLRRDFLDPFFDALGWDIDNRAGHAEAYRDVIHEDALRVEKTVKAPDYCFRIGGVRKFFVEAKKPAVDIKQHGRTRVPTAPLRLDGQTAAFDPHRFRGIRRLRLPHQARQGRQRLHRPRPILLNTPNTSTSWDEIAGIFSREAILKGSFDKYAESNKKKRGTAEVDDAFLEEIESWRSTCAQEPRPAQPAIYRSAI